MTDLARDGYVVLRGLLAVPELDEVAPRVDRLVRQGVYGSCARPNNTLLPLRWDDPIVGLVAGDPARADRIRAVAGATDLRWISGYVSVKDPASPPLWWHQDWWCWDHPVSYLAEPSQVALLCYLTGTDVHNGALRVLPGSHARSVRVHAALPEAHADPMTSPDLDHDAMRDQPGQRTLALRAGDAVLLDYRLLHGTHANASSRRRDCLILNFTPCWAGLPAEIRGHLISHPALPHTDERPPPSWPVTRLLPNHDGPRRDLDLNRNAPADFLVR